MIVRSFTTLMRDTRFDGTSLIVDSTRRSAEGESVRVKLACRSGRRSN